jgi:tetratricopeptide (TPR) repeat protein
VGRRFKSCRAGHFIKFPRAELPPVLRATISVLAHKSASRPRRRGRTAIGLPPAIAGALALSLLPAVATAHGGLSEQIDAVTKEIAAHPGDATLYVKRGELHRFDGQIAAALADYIDASRIDPSLPEADLGRGRALLDANRAARAREPLVRFLKARPDHAEGRLALARCLAKLGRQTESAAEYTRAIGSFSPPGTDLYVERARVLATGGRPAEAIRGLDEGIERLGPLVALHKVAIELDVKRRNWSGALDRIDRITASSATPATWLARRGEVVAAARLDTARTRE